MPPSFAWCSADGPAVRLAHGVVAGRGRHRRLRRGHREPVPTPPASEPLPRKVARRLRDAGSWAPVAFVLLYVLTCIACLPTLFLAVAAGALWGFGLGLAHVWAGMILGSASAFLIGRHLARGWVQRRLAGHPRLEAIEQAVSEEGWRIVVLARLSPGSPFFLLNYVFGLTRIGFWEHLAATAFSALPGAMLLVYLGSAGEWVLDGRHRTPGDWLLFGVGLVALVAGVRLLSRRSRRILDARLRRQEGSPASPAPPE